MNTFFSGVGILYLIVAVIVFFNIIPKHQLQPAERVRRYCKCAVVALGWLPLGIIVGIWMIWFIGRLIDILIKIAYK